MTQAFASTRPRSPSFSLAFRILFLITGLVLAGCQSVETQDVLGSVEQAMPPAPSADEVLGKGTAKVALILPRGAAGDIGTDAEEFRNGAALAMNDLGGEQLSLSILVTGGDAAVAREKMRKTITDGAQLIIGPTTAAELQAVAAARTKNLPPIIALVDNGAKRAAGIYPLLSDEIDSAGAVAAQAIANGKADILVATGPSGLSKDAAARVKSIITKAGGRHLGLVTVSAAETAGDVSQIAKASAVLLLASAEPNIAATLLRANGLAGDAQFLGTAQWSRQHYGDAALAGALVPAPEQSGLREIESRMRAAYGRPMSMESAYAYDAVALAAGLVRAIGADAFSPAVLKQPIGFRGATGAFRFNEDGSVSRLYGIYQLDPKGLKLIRPAADSF